MPPRFAYWTILIDDAPTAFRAREAEELLPTLNQLKRKNKNVALKWFARGRLWESQQQEHEDFQRRKWGTGPPGAPPGDRSGDGSRGGSRDGSRDGERRGKDWRPGGEHKDPRARFDKEKRRREKREQREERNRAAGPRRFDNRPEPPRPGGTRGPDDKDGNAPPRPASGGKRPWAGKPGGRPPRGDRPWTAKPPGGGPPRGDRPWSAKPPGGGPPRGDRPWSAKPGGPPRGDRPWSAKPPGGGPPRGDRPWTGKPGGARGDRPWSGKPGGPPRGDRPWAGKPKDREHRPWQNKPAGGPRAQSERPWRDDARRKGYGNRPPGQGRPDRRPDRPQPWQKESAGPRAKPEDPGKPADGVKKPDPPKRS